MIKRFKKVINNENGGPMVESVIAIAVALMVIVAVGAFGAVLINWISTATGSISTLGG